MHCLQIDEDADSGESDSPASDKKLRGSFTEYEVALLWNQFRENFASGRVNKLQLAQMLDDLGIGVPDQQAL